MGLSEAVLYNEVTKLLRQQQFRDRNRYPDAHDLQITKPRVPPKPEIKVSPSYYSEREMVRLLLKYGANVYGEKEVEGTRVAVTVADFIVHEITSDELGFTDRVFGEVFTEYKFHVDQGIFPGDHHFVRHPDPEISQLSVDLLADSYELSRIWQERQSFVESEDRMLKEIVEESVLKFKSDKIKEMRALLLVEIGTAAAAGDMEAVGRLQKQVNTLNRVMNGISKSLGKRIVL